MELPHSLLRRHFTGKPVVGSRKGRLFSRAKKYLPGKYTSSNAGFDISNAVRRDMNVTFKFLELKKKKSKEVYFTKKSHSASSSQKLKSESSKHRRKHKVSIFSATKDKSEEGENNSFDVIISALERTLLLQTFCGGIVARGLHAS